MSSHHLLLPLWEGNSSGCLDLVCPSAVSPGSLRTASSPSFCKLQADGSVRLACRPLQGWLIPRQKLESPPLPTHTLCCRLGQAAWPLQVGFLLCPAGRTTELDTLRCDDSEHQVCVTCRAGDRAWCRLMGLMVPPGPLRPTWVLSPARSTFPLCPRRCSESEFEGSHCRHPSARPATLLCFLWVLHLFAGSHQASALQGLGAQ